MASDKKIPAVSTKAKLDELVDIAVHVSSAKGWNVKVTSRDTESFKYASFEVERDFGGTVGWVKAVFEITCTKNIEMSGRHTSFYSNGVKDLRDAIWEEFSDLAWIKPIHSDQSVVSVEDKALVARLLRRFHRAVRQLKYRYADRPGLVIADEYDVQDYLHGFLRALFDDVRAEEYTPSYAGGASRIDFLLKAQEIAIEIKLASKTLSDRKVGEQLLIDIQRYQAHPSCKTLFCFVYDPDQEIRNPSGLEADLTKIYDKLDVRVIVVSPS